MIAKALLYPAAAGLLCACSFGGGSASAPMGSTHSVRLKQPPHEAARCFARNAEEHSSALVAELTPTRAGADVVVRVKNGVTYATASFEPARAGSSAKIALMVRTSGRRSDLLDALVAGC